jgi:hypothetical protein
MWAINAFKSLVVRTTVNDVRFVELLVTYHGKVFHKFFHSLQVNASSK